MDDLFEGFGNGSTQDNFDLAALSFFAELDRQAGKEPDSAPQAQAVPPVSAEAPAPAEPPAEEGPLTDMDSLDLMLMRQSENMGRPGGAKPAPRRKPVKKPPFVRAREEALQSPRSPEPSGPASAAGQQDLSPLALDAARLFQSLPTEDQLLAYTLLQKLAKAGKD